MPCKIRKEAKKLLQKHIVSGRGPRLVPREPELHDPVGLKVEFLAYIGGGGRDCIA